MQAGSSELVGQLLQSLLVGLELSELFSARAGVALVGAVALRQAVFVVLQLLLHLGGGLAQDGQALHHTGGHGLSAVLAELADQVRTLLELIQVGHCAGHLHVLAGGRADALEHVVELVVQTQLDSGELQVARDEDHRDQDAEQQQGAETQQPVGGGQVFEGAHQADLFHVCRVQRS